MKYYLAIDIGASSGRHILCHTENGKLQLEEIYRFDNGFIERDGHFYWDVDSLFFNIREGIKKCSEINKIPVSIGIDTWGVDYALLDENDKLIDGVFAYRDSRTETALDKVYGIVPKTELFSITGTAENNFNTIFQLYCDKESGKLDRAATMLFIPDYLNYLLTGEKRQEYTFASTTGLLDAKSRDWSEELLDRLGYPKKLFGKLSQPGETVGNLTEDVKAYVGFDSKVILTASHDTASAVIAVPANDSPLYISSGTWSLFGIEAAEPLLTEEALASGFSNEGGIYRTIRLLQNIMGLWMIQSIKRENKGKYGYQDLMLMAMESNYDGIYDANDSRLLAPKSMMAAISECLVEKGFSAPNGVADTVRAAYRSLAASYAKAADSIERMTGNKYDTIYIVGGGSKDEFLNKLTAEFSGRNVVTGVTEATAIGNLAVQLIADGEVATLRDARAMIANSFNISKI